MREGLDDRRYVETLKRMAADHQTDVSDFLADLARAAISQRTAAGRDTVNDFFAEAKDMDATDAMRSQGDRPDPQGLHPGLRDQPRGADHQTGYGTVKTNQIVG